MARYHDNISCRFEHNDVLVSGIIADTPGETIVAFGEEMCVVTLNVMRVSQTVDSIPVYIPVRLIAVSPTLTLNAGDFVSVSGKLLSVAGQNGRNYAKVVASLVANQSKDAPYINKVSITGEISIDPLHYTTSLTGRKITTVVLSLPFSIEAAGGASHIPTILWGRAAEVAAEYKKGETISVCGRIQSRDVSRTDENGNDDSFEMVEVSASALTPIGRMLGFGEGIFG